VRIAPDGGPVQLYARLPERTADAEPMHWLPRRAALAARAGLRTDATLNAAGTLVLLRPVSDAGGVGPDEARSGR
jgi:hypothetical protein